MKLYNTLTRKIEDLKPINPPKVTVYTCGPTVYDYPHIGNWFTFIRYDLLIRALKTAGYNPNWVMNITDVGHLVSDADEGEDKLEKGAKRESKTAWQVAEYYSDNFIGGLKKLNITPPNELPKATEHIQDQIDLIKDLENKGYTYQITDGIYYDTSKFSYYGKMAKIDLKRLKEGARVEVNPEKRNPTDFALWKFSPKKKTRDMEWSSPWGKGFPGWHLECSAMSMKYLGSTLDIHAGGIEHIPVHHTNEIAQSEAATGKPFVNVWVHMNHIMIGGEKIAKSTRNGITLEDIEKRGYSPESLRLLVVESHYRTQAEFSWDTLEAAKNRLMNFYRMADLRWQPKNVDSWLENNRDGETIKNSLLDDLNTPLVLAAVNELSSKCEERLISNNEIRMFADILGFIDSVLGLKLAKRTDISAEDKQIITKRETARQSKDWTKSDDLRNKLSKKGIGLRDTAHGAIWYRL